MTDYTDTDNQAEIAALNHEIYRLTKEIQDRDKRDIADSMCDKRNPFNNPTEYKDFNPDYTDILPEITEPGIHPPLEPSYAEKRRIRHYYAIGGGTVLFRFVMSNWIAALLILLVFTILRKINPQADGQTIYSYMRGSAIFAAINMLVYLVSNVMTALGGLSLCRVKLSSLFKTRDFKIWDALKYCNIAVFLLMASILASDFVEDIFSQYGTTTNVVSFDGVAVTALGGAIMTIYRCIIAPVTEELFFRGMLLKCLSRSNQRFAVFATAVFFGLSHSNIPQFILAFIMGIFMAHITLKHNSIIPSIIVHIFVNTFTTIASSIPTKGVLLGMFNMTYVVLSILGLIMLIVFRTNDKLPATTPAQSRRGFSIASTSILMFAAFWLQVLYMLSFVFSHPLLDAVRDIL